METLQRTANRGSVSTGYDVDNSCKFEDANSEAMVKSLSSQSRDCFTISFWLKRTSLGASRLCGAGPDGNNEVIIHFTSSNELEIYSWEGAYAMRYKTNRVFRDTSAFYHFAFLIDTRLSTASERTQIYVNGVLETSFSVSVVPGQNSLLDWTTNIQVGRGGPAADADMSGYLAEFVYLDDTKAAHTDLGEFDSNTGIWKPKDVSGLTFGTNGAYLDFKDSSNMGNDANGGTDFSLTNITAADQATDTCTNNFCTWSPLWVYATNRTISEGGTKLTGSSAWGGCKGSIGVTNGKWYWENKASGNDTIIGWQTDGDGNIYSGNAHNVLDTIGLYQDGNYIWIKDSTSGRNDTSASGSNASGQIIGFALDLDSSPQTATFYRNGSAIASDVNIDGLTGKTLFPFISQYNQNTEANFGGYTSFTISSSASDGNGYGTFEYAPPSGYYAICTKNLAEYG